MTGTRIVVGVDSGEPALHAVIWAVRECRLRGGELLLLHAMDRRDAPRARELGEPALRAGDEFAERLLADTLARVRTLAPDLPVRTLLSHAAPSEALIDTSADAALLVLGTNGAADVAASLLGSVGRRVATHAHSPVVIVPPAGLPSGSGGIVVGLAPTRAGRLALRFALDQARLHDCSVDGIRCGPAGPDSEPDPLGTVGEAAGASWPQVRFAVRRVDAEPAAALLEAARTAQLLVLGCHHSDEHWSARLGSVPAALLGRCPCPVALVGQRD